jgi:hypothetical protein
MELFMNDRIFKDDFNERLFAKAVSENFSQTLSNDFAEASKAEFSKRHKAKMAKIFEKEEIDSGINGENITNGENTSAKFIQIDRLSDKKRKNSFFIFAKWAVGVAASLVFVFAGISGYFFSVPEVRAAVLQSVGAVPDETAVLNEPEPDPVLQKGGAANAATDTKTGKIPPEAMETLNIGQIMRFDAQGNFVESHFVINIRQIGGDIVGSENYLWYYSEESGVKYRIYESEIDTEPSLIVWDHGDATMWLYGTEPANDLLKEAKKIEKNSK